MHDRNIFGSSLKVFWQSSHTMGNFWKFSENVWEHTSCFRMNFMFSWQEQYLPSEQSERVRYCSCHLNIKFISSCHRVISPMTQGGSYIYKSQGCLSKYSQKHTCKGNQDLTYVYIKLIFTLVQEQMNVGFLLMSNA